MSRLELTPGIQPLTFVRREGKTYFFIGKSEDGMAEILLPDSDIVHRVPLQTLRIASGDKFPTARFLDFEEYPPE